MDFSKLRRSEVIGAAASLVLLLSLLFLPWYSLTDVPEREAQNAWICGEQEFSCTGFETFPILRWLLLAAAAAPLILAWIVVRGHSLGYPPGELTMTVGFTSFVLIGYNGILDKPGVGEFGISLDFGYFLALFAALAMAVGAASRSLEHGGGGERKAAGTI